MTYLVSAGQSSNFYLPNIYPANFDDLINDVVHNGEQKRNPWQFILRLTGEGQGLVMNASHSLLNAKEKGTSLALSNINAYKANIIHYDEEIIPYTHKWAPNQLRPSIRRFYRSVLGRLLAEYWVAIFARLASVFLAS